MTKRQRRTRIVTLIAIAGLAGLLHFGASGPLEHWLGWTNASNVLFGVTAVLMLAAAWNLLGFFIDKDEQKTGGNRDSNTPP